MVEVSLLGMQRIRPFLFWTFVGVFFITASSVLFYTFGYRFNFQRGIFIYTGSISIKSNPETVGIRVDDELIPNAKLGILNNSIHLGGLTPGEHFIEVMAPGYSSWSKKTTVQSGRSTEFWNVLLVKESPAVENIAGTENALKIFQAPKQGLFAVIKEKDDQLTVDALDTNADQSDQLLSLPDVSLPQDSEENIEWSPDNRKVLVPLEQDSTRLYLIVDIETKQISPLHELTKNQGKNSLRNPRWDPTNRDILFYLEGTALQRIDTKAPDNSPILVKENVRDYNFSGKNIYYLSDDNGIIYRLPAERIDSEPAQITTAPIDIIPDSFYSLVAYDDSRLTIREQKTGRLFVYNKSPSAEIVFKPIAGSGTKGVQFSNDGKKLLFFTDNEISVYFMRDWEAQPTRAHDTIIQIARFSNTLRNVQWTADYEHVLFSLNGSAKIIELDNRDRRNILDFATSSTPYLQILSRFEENYIYLVSAQDSGTTQVSRIQFTQPSNFFGF
ncbi:MAG: hypothetical protein Q8Q10_04050 [bacterium]|nr:hypothetical protein [bacterium]